MRPNELDGTIRSIVIDYEAKVMEVAGSLRTTIPLTLAKQLSLERGDTILLNLVEIGNENPVRALLLRKKTSTKRS